MKLLISLMTLLLSFNLLAISKTELNLVSYNVWMIPFQGKKIVQRSQAIGRAIKDYDLVFLQEAFSKDNKRQIAKYAERDLIYNRYKSYHPTILSSGKFTLSSFEITNARFYQFKNCGGVQCLAKKGVLYVQIRLPNGVLLDTFNTHLQAFENNDQIRKNQLIEAVKFISNINDGIRPIIFAGDFNVIAENNENIIFKELMPEFRDVWTHIHSSLPGYTWDPEINPWAKYDERESKKFQRVDYIFVKDGKNSFWDINSSKVVFDKEMIWYDILYRKHYIYGSDHFGISTDLTLNSF